MEKEPENDIIEEEDDIDIDDEFEEEEEEEEFSDNDNISEWNKNGLRLWYHHNLKFFDTIQVTISFGDFNYLYEMVGRPGIGRMNERDRPTFHGFVSVGSDTQYELA